MARIHARTRGSSGSRRPVTTEVPEWMGLTKKEVKEKVIELAKSGKSTAQIGTILRDTYAVPSVKLVTGSSVLAILTEAKVAPKLPEDMQNLIVKAIRIDEHLKEKPKDIHNRRGMALTEAKIRSMARYYKRIGRLPETWNYSIKTARLLVE